MIGNIILPSFSEHAENRVFDLPEELAYHARKGLYQGGGFYCKSTYLDSKIVHRKIKSLIPLKKYGLTDLNNLLKENLFFNYLNNTNREDINIVVLIEYLYFMKAASPSLYSVYLHDLTQIAVNLVGITLQPEKSLFWLEKSAQMYVILNSNDYKFNVTPALNNQNLSLRSDEIKYYVYLDSVIEKIKLFLTIEYTKLIKDITSKISNLSIMHKYIKYIYELSNIIHLKKLNASDLKRLDLNIAT